MAPTASPGRPASALQRLLGSDPNVLARLRRLDPHEDQAMLAMISEHLVLPTIPFPGPHLPGWIEESRFCKTDYSRV